jgi:predicted nucleic acid-binding protein
MNKDGLPLSSWQRVKDSINLTREETEEVTKDILNFLDKFDIFKTIDDNENICMLISERFDYNLISELVLNHHFRTHDAILVSSAINSDCDFFITGDKSIRNKKIDNIKIISPQTMLQSLKQI